MRQEITTSNALKGGCSFDYRDIFSGLSNEKMSPVLCMSLPLIQLAGKTLHTILYALITSNFPYPKHINRWPAHFWQKAPPPWFFIAGFQVHTGSICFHLLKGKSLVLLKTNFSKKPKNPV
ncbi:MAG: hypothetical protein Q8L07_08615 [Sediminibacterium sp.]|nr:hypothetical protein [Sediminibacterium sp.]